MPHKASVLRNRRTDDGDYGGGLLVHASLVAVQSTDSVVRDEQVIRRVEPGVLVVERLQACENGKRWYDLDRRTAHWPDCETAPSLPLGPSETYTHDELQ